MTEQPHQYSVDQLLQAAGLPRAGDENIVRDLAIDSREVGSGGLFLAMPGAAVDGRRYITDALKRGAAAVLAEKAGATAEMVSESRVHESRVHVVQGLRSRAGLIADQFFGKPSRHLKVVGVTGTNGKSSVCHFIGQLLAFAGEHCALMGTLGQGYLDDLMPMQNTTADAVSIQRYLHQLHRSGGKWLAMEVSSHGLEQYRVVGVEFSSAVFTNLSRDHLDYHGSMDDYARAKMKLFADHRVQNAVINLDDLRVGEALNAARNASQRMTFSLQSSKADLFAEEVHFHRQGIRAVIQTPWGRQEINTPLLGAFNLSNLLAAMSVMLLEGFDIEKLALSTGKLQTVPGRLQSLGGCDAPQAIVDYAHTPDALRSALDALRAHTRGRLTCIFGCGGDRDKGKRPLMLQAALKCADGVVLTSDNPRTENPEQIIDDALKGVSTADRKRVKVYVDRREAIASTIKAAAVGEVILVAGKGHEDYQEINKQRFPFDDREEVKAALERYEHAG